MISEESQEATELEILKPFVDPFETGAAVRQPSDGQSSDVPDQEIFSCPNCPLVFGKFCIYEKHMDVGCTQKISTEERAKRIWVNLRTVDPGNKVDCSGTAQMASSSAASDVVLLKMGWALKTNKSSQRMTLKVLNYLTEIFNNGEKTGEKREPVDVAKEMKTLMMDDGERVFSQEEWLNKKQVFSFWSRLKSQRKLNVVSSSNNAEAEMNGKEDDADATAVAMDENHLGESVDLQHPVKAFGENICELVESNQIQDLDIELLRKVCKDLGLELSSRAHRKSCIKKIKEFVQEECPNCSIE